MSDEEKPLFRAVFTHAHHKTHLVIGCESKVELSRFIAFALKSEGYTLVKFEEVGDDE